MKKVFMTAIVVAMFCVSCSLEEVEPVNVAEVHSPSPTGGEGDDVDCKDDCD